MRPKLVIGVLLGVACLLGFMVMVSRELGGGSRSVEQPPPPLASMQVAPVQQTQAVMVVSAPDKNSSNHADYVRQRADELMTLAMRNDSASLETILSELQNSDPQIRKAALDATVQFSDRAAIPRLRDLAARTSDDQEKEQLLDAANYLALPSLTEVLARQQAQRQALGLTNPPVRDPNRIARRASARLQPAAPVQADAAQ